MTRPVKFRGLRVDGKGWVYGGITSLSHTPDGKKYIVTSEGFENDEENEKLVFIEIIPETAGQFTGLVDKFGKEVYEGDKIQTEKLGFAYVVWDDAAFAMKSPSSEAIDWVHSSEYTKSEVIGNIHEESEVNL